MIDASEGARHQPPRAFPHRHKVLSAVLALSLALGGWWGVRLWQLRRSVDQYRSFWSVARGEAGGILYVALGDSTAQGIGASGPERVARQRHGTTLR